MASVYYYIFEFSIYLSNMEKLERKLKLHYNKLKMFETIFKEQPTKDNRLKLYSIIDLFDDILSEYYSEWIFTLKLKNEALFELNLSLHKETVKRNLLTDLILKWKNEKR